MNRVRIIEGNRSNPDFDQVFTARIQDSARGNDTIITIQIIGGSVLAPKNPPVTIILLGLNSINPIGVSNE